MSVGAATLAVEIGDPDATRTVIAIVALLAVMGVALVMLALWQRRETRPDPTFLAPLELMGDRAWRRGDPVWQRRRLDEVRPRRAQPLRKAPAPPTLDESFDAGPAGGGFDDLGHDGAATGHSPDRASDSSAMAPDHSDNGVPVDSIGDETTGGQTPVSSCRPLVDDLPDDVDSDALRQALEDLDVELGGGAGDM